MATTLGKMMIDDALPEDMRDQNRVFNKKQSGQFFADLAAKHPDKYVDVLKKLTDISRVAGTEYGGVASIGLSDLKIPPRLKAYRQELRDRIDIVAQNPQYSTKQKQDKIVDVMRKAMPKIMKDLQSESASRGNAFAHQMEHGFRGNPSQFAQLVFGDMLVADHNGNPIPIPGTHGYGEGVTPTEYWAGSYGARKGYADVQFATAKTGFFGKQMALMANRLKVTGEDCGASQVGVSADGDDPEIIGAVLAKDVGKIKAGTTIDKKHLPLLRASKPLVRSLVTCQQPEGVCQKCSGKRDQGEFPPMDSYVGITAARVMSEPMTQQLGLSAKHTGGVVGVNDQNVSGFDEINQFLQIPKAFKGAAALAPIDGKVMGITKAPQGGSYVKVNDQEIYIPEGREILVKKGDSMEAGDMLSSGTPNPGEMAEYKGLGGGREYFTNKFYEILKNNGVPTHRRNVETLSRAFFDKIRVTRPEGVAGYGMDEVVSYSDLQRDYKPRKSAKALSPQRGIGSYLEKPVLHYTIGTRITPKVAKRLKEQDIKEIITHTEDPGFAPEVIRLMGISAVDKDWKAQMAGFGLKKSFLDSARKGSESKHDSTSYVSDLMDPTKL